MHKSLGDIIELVIFILFISYGTTLGVKGLYDIYRETYSYSLEIEDKNAATKLSDVIFTGDYDTLLTQSELALMTQIQDYGMPAPNNLMIGGKQIEIDTSRYDNTLTYITELNSVFKDQYKYLVRFDYKTNTYYCTPYDKKQDPVTKVIQYTAKEVVKKLNTLSASTSPMITAKDKTIEIRAGAQNCYATYSNVVQNGKTYLITFRAYSLVDNDPLVVDIYPDDLPEKSFRLTTVPTSYSWLVTIPNTSEGKSKAQQLRFFISSEKNKGNITISNIEITEY